MNQMSTSLPDGVVLPFEAQTHAITPFFKHMSVLNEAQSELKGEAVYDLKEMVELRFAGDRNYSPIFEAQDMWRRENNRIITYAERFSDQYRAFVQGDNQAASGTALEMLKPYGITPQQISLCNALKVYSIEAILEMKNANALGMSTNALRDMANQWKTDNDRKVLSKTADDIAEMQAEIERLRALIPANDPTPEEMEEAILSVDHPMFGGMSDVEIKDWIAQQAGARPRGNPSRATLISMAQEILGNTSKAG